MRVLVVSQYYWPENFRINDVVKTLLEKDVLVEVLTGQPNYPEGKIFHGYRAWKCQRTVHQKTVINRVPLIKRGRRGWQLALNYLSFVVSGILFAPILLRKKKFDVIFVYGTSPILQAIPAIFLGWLKKCPTVLWVQDLWPDSLSATGYVRNRTILKLIEWVTCWIYRHVDVLLVQSKAFEIPVRSLAGDTPILYYPNSVDNIFSLSATADVPHIDGLEEGFSVMFAGNIGTAQAVGVILDAASFLKDRKEIQFVMVGDGSCRGQMLREAERRGLKNVHLPGRFPVEMMPGFMHKASALLVTLADEPIFAVTVPNKVQAYMAAGRPIIASLNGEGARLILEAKAGLATPAEDSRALADAILSLQALSVKDREDMGNNGRLYYQTHFDHDSLVDQLIGYLRSVSQSRKGLK